MHLLQLAFGTALAIAFTACGDGGSAAVVVTQRDYGIEVAPEAVEAGTIRFEIENQGSADHEFAVLRTDFAEDALPIRDGQWVDKSAVGIEEVGGFDHVFPDRPKEIELQLVPGNYLIICNIQGHYQLGMRTPFQVTD